VANNAVPKEWECNGELWRGLLVDCRLSALLPANEPSLSEPFIEGMKQHLARYGVALTPLLVLRVREVLVCLLVVLHLEKGLLCGQEEEVGSRTVAGADLETLGKAQERLRKAMNDLEESCAKAGTPIDKGLADVMKPILQRAKGILEDALAFEARKRAKKKPARKRAG